MSSLAIITVVITAIATAAGSGNVSYELQPELHNCTTVQELELVTAATCQHSASVWMARQPQALSELTALTSDNQQCSIEQVIINTVC